MRRKKKRKNKRIEHFSYSTVIEVFVNFFFTPKENSKNSIFIIPLLHHYLHLVHSLQGSLNIIENQSQLNSFFSLFLNTNLILCHLHHSSLFFNEFSLSSQLIQHQFHDYDDQLKRERKRKVENPKIIEENKKKQLLFQ